MSTQMRNLLPVTLVTMFILGTTLTVAVPSALAQTTYVSVINPDTGDGNFIYTNLSPPPAGGIIVNITVTDVEMLAGWQVNLTWDPTLLNISDTSTGPFVGDLYAPADHVFNGLNPQFPAKNINNAYGFVGWSCAVGPAAPVDHFNGSGTLMCVKFTVKKAPSEGETLSCNLRLDKVGMFETKLVDPDGETIDFTEQNGYYEYEWPTPPPPPPTPPTLAVDPPSIINPAMVPPKTFEINITIANVTDLYAYEFSLSYDPTILHCISLTIRDPLNETNYNSEFAVNNTKGLVWVKVSYYSPAVPITTNASVTLVTLIFRVKGFGATLLDLHDTSLTDYWERPITHDANDGFFANLVRDLAVVSVVPLVSVAYQGWIVKINVTVRNEGEIAETLFDVKAYYDNDTIDTITVPSLDPHSEYTLTFSWDTADVPPCNNYTISAEAVPVPFELNLTNNFLSDGDVKIKLMGDVNGDGVVDIQDLVLLIKAFGSYPSHPRWNPNSDLNGDGKIDIIDLVLVIKSFGAVC